MRTASVCGLVGLSLFMVVFASPGQLQAGVYSDEVLSDNPYAYWRMGELFGTTAMDAAMNGGQQDGSYHNWAGDGFPTLGAAGIPGTVGGTGVAFHGGSPTSQLYVADPVDPTAYTLEAWVKADSGATTSRNIMLRTDGDPTTTFSYQLRIEPTGAFRNYLWDGHERYMDSTTTVQADQWYHVVGVATEGPGYANHLDLYVNGVKEAEADWTGGAFWTGGDEWRIGSLASKDATLRDWFDGTIDEVAIYHYDIGEDAVLRHYQAGIAPVTPTKRYPSTIPTMSLDLADMVGGGDGTGTGTLDAGINPGTGALIPAGTPNPETVTGPGYHTVALDFVDGVFIPGDNSAGMQIDSTGTTVGYPNRDARSWDHIRNGPNEGVDSVLSGVDYATGDHSLIGAHANKGITFDLDEIRAANPDLEIGQFTTVFGNVDSTGGRIDVNVYLDGVLMYGIGGNLPTGTPLQVGISQNDRFLTLVASSNDDNYNNDQAIFGDPRLELGNNVALGKQAYAWAEYDGFPAYNLTDGDLNDQYPGDDEGRSFWLGPDSQTGDVIVDLDELHFINRVDLQNTHNGRWNDRGVEDFTLLVSEDGQAWTEITTGTLTQFASSNIRQNIPIESFNFSPLWARYVKIQVDSIYGASAGLNEIRVFEKVPEPGTLVLLGLGLLGLAACGRRRKRSA